jgi:hypothetical protein
LSVSLYTPLSAGKVLLSLQKGDDWVPYDEHNLDDGGAASGDEYGKTKAYLQFPDYDAMLQGDRRWKAGKVVNRLLMRDIKLKVDQKVATVRQHNAVWGRAPLIYRMLYRGSADTRTGTTGDVHFKLSVTEAGSDSRTLSVRPAITGSGVLELNGDGEQEFNIVVQNVNVGESFVVAHVDGDQAFIHVYVILGQLKYILVRGEFLKVAQELHRARISIPAVFQQALQGIAQATVLASAPTSSPPPAAPPSPKPETDEASSQPTVPRPKVPLPRLSSEALQHPLVKNNAQSQLWAWDGNQWRSYGQIKKAYLGILDATRKARVRDLLLPQKGRGMGGIPLSQNNKDRDEAWQGFYDTFVEEIMSISDDSGHDARERLLQQFCGLEPGEGGRMAQDFSDRLGLPLVQATVKFIALPEDGVVQALVLPLVAKIAEPMPLAVLSIGPNGWEHWYDYDENDPLTVCSFPTISGIGLPVLKRVYPEAAMATDQIVRDACKWYALAPDILARLDNGPQAVCYFAIHSHGVEMHLTLLQKMSLDEEIPIPDSVPVVLVPAVPTPPRFWMDLAGVRLLEMRYLAKVYPLIQEDAHYKALLRIVNLAHHNRVYYTYEPTYYWDRAKPQEGDKRFYEWRVILGNDNNKTIPYIIPYLEQIDFSEDEPRAVYYDFFESKEARKKAGKATDLSSMEQHEAGIDVFINMEKKHALFTSQWESQEGLAYKKLREMKGKVMSQLSRDSIQAQMLDLDWWEYRDQLCNEGLGPLLGQEFRDVLSEAVHLEER